MWFLPCDTTTITAPELPLPVRLESASLLSHIFQLWFKFHADNHTLPTYFVDNQTANAKMSNC